MVTTRPVISALVWLPGRILKLSGSLFRIEWEIGMREKTTPQGTHRALVSQRFVFSWVSVAAGGHLIIILVYLTIVSAGMMNFFCNKSNLLVLV